MTPAEHPYQRAGALAVAGAVAISLVAYVPSLALSPIVIRMAIVLPLAGWGSVWLVYLAWTGDHVARWCAAFIAWTFVASWLSPERHLALFGSLSNDREWIYHAAFIACWAVGRLLVPAGRRVLALALLVGIGINALVAMVQARGGGSGVLAMADGRPAGLASSPVFLGALLGAGIALVAALAARSSMRWPWPWLFAIIGLVAAADLSGSRSSLLIGVSLGVVVTARASWRVAVAFALACGAGLLLVALLWSSTATGTGRLEDGGGGGVRPRVQMWQAGIEAAGERPLTGYGDGRFRAATAGRADLEFARAEGPDRPFFDAHNVLVEVLVAGGVVSLALVGGMGLTMARTSRGPLAWFGLAMALSWLLEPVSVITAPVAFLALGAASSGPPVEVDDARVRRWLIAAATALTLVALVQSVRILDTARLLRAAERDRSISAIETVRQRFPRDPALSDTEAQIRATYAVDGDAAQRAAALAAARQTVQLEATRHLWWYNLARYEYLYGSGSAAERRARTSEAITQGLEQSPWSLSLLQTQRELALIEGDRAEAERIAARLCRLGFCPRDEPTD